MQTTSHALRLRRLGIATYKEAVLYIRQDSYICKAEGFEVPTRIMVRIENKSVIATLNIITSDLLRSDEASLSEWAWEMLEAKEGDLVYLSHPPPLNSMEQIHNKIRGATLDLATFHSIIKDITSGYLSDIQIAAFLSACADGRLNLQEITDLTAAMLASGQRIKWTQNLVVDKHCIGGLPGNRTTLILVPIVAACGLTIPKTSSRFITSSAGTADTMETLAPVNLSFAHIQKVIAQEHGCIVWGNAALCPADDIMIRIERGIGLNSQGQMVASVLSKKIAAGSNHVLIDIPVGATAKIKDIAQATILKDILEHVGLSLGIRIKTIFTDGIKPVGRGIGPALEAYDALAVLQNQQTAPQDLKERALLLAGEILEFSPQIAKGQGLQLARTTLASGKAWHKFQAICEAQGGMRIPPKAPYTYTHVATTSGGITSINNLHLALLAKLAGAPNDKAAGVYLQANVGDKVNVGQPLFTVHAEHVGELDYAINFLKNYDSIMQIETL